MAAIQKTLITIAVLSCLFGAGYCQEDNNDTNVAEGRTFAHHFLKRISFAIVPGAFIIGVVTTLLAALTVVSMKGLGVGVILLIIAIGQMLSRALPIGSAAVYSAQSPPLVYSHSHSQASPVWVDNKW